MSATVSIHPRTLEEIDDAKVRFMRAVLLLPTNTPERAVTVRAVLSAVLDSGAASLDAPEPLGAHSLFVAPLRSLIADFDFTAERFGPLPAKEAAFRDRLKAFFARRVELRTDPF